MTNTENQQLDVLVQHLAKHTLKEVKKWEHLDSVEKVIIPNQEILDQLRKYVGL